MKRKLLYLGALFLGLGLFAQDLPNGDFEEWEETFSYEEPNVDNFLGSSLVSIVEGGLPNLKRDTLDGSQALFLYNDDFANFAFALFGDTDDDNEELLFTNGTPFDTPKSPYSLQLNTEYDLAEGDTANVFISLSSSGTVVSLTKHEIIGASNGTETIEILLDYPLGPILADSFVVGITGDSPDDSTGLGGEGYLGVDNLVFLTETGSVSYEIPYGDFEDWKTISGEAPVGFFINSRALPNESSFKESMNPLEGQHSLKLVSGELFTGEVTAGLLAIGGFDENNEFELDYIPVTAEYDRITITYSYEEGIEEDSASFFFIGTQGNTDNAVAIVEEYLRDTEGEIIIDTFDIIGFETPDSMSLLVASSDLDNEPILGSTLIIDDIRLLQKDVVGLQDEIARKYAVYPNPSKGSLNISPDAGTIKIYDLKGILVMEQTPSIVTELDLDKGVYFYELYSNSSDLLYKDKLIVE